MTCRCWLSAICTEFVDLQDAPVGGESTIARNVDLGTTHPSSVRSFLEEHGGIVYRRTFYDARNPPPGARALE